MRRNNNGNCGQGRTFRPQMVSSGPYGSSRAPNCGQTHTFRPPMVGTCPCNIPNVPNGTAHTFQAIPLQTETTTECGRQVLYFRFAAQPESEESGNNGQSCTADGQECNQNCNCTSCSSPNSKGNLPNDFSNNMPSCTQDGQNCNSNCDCDNCKSQNSEANFAGNADNCTDKEETKAPLLWWTCDKPDCECHKIMNNANSAEFDAECNTCTFTGENGERIVVPCHHCFTFEAARPPTATSKNCCKNKRPSTATTRRPMMVRCPQHGRPSYYVANGQNQCPCQCGGNNARQPQWKRTRQQGSCSCGRCP